MECFKIQNLIFTYPEQEVTALRRWTAVSPVFRRMRFMRWQRYYFCGSCRSLCWKSWTG